MASWIDAGYGTQLPEDIQERGYRRSVIKALVVKLVHDKGYVKGGIHKFGSSYQVMMKADSMVALLANGEYRELVNYSEDFNFELRPSSGKSFASDNIFQQTLLALFNDRYQNQGGKNRYENMDNLSGALLETRASRENRGIFSPTGFRRWQVIRSILGESFDFDSFIKNSIDAQACLVQAFLPKSRKLEFYRSMYEKEYVGSI